MLQRCLQGPPSGGAAVTLPPEVMTNMAYMQGEVEAEMAAMQGQIGALESSLQQIAADMHRAVDEVRKG